MKAAVILIFSMLSASAVAAEADPDGFSDTNKRPLRIAAYTGSLSGECHFQSKPPLKIKGAQKVIFYYYAEMPKRIWVNITGTDDKMVNGDYLLGQSDMCYINHVRDNPN